MIARCRGIHFTIIACLCRGGTCPLSLRSLFPMFLQFSPNVFSIFKPQRAFPPSYSAAHNEAIQSPSYGFVVSVSSLTCCPPPALAAIINTAAAITATSITHLCRSIGPIAHPRVLSFSPSSLSFQCAHQQVCLSKFRSLFGQSFGAHFKRCLISEMS